MSNILCIEPNAVLARTYAEALRHAGHTVAIAATAQDAIYAADEDQPDVVVLELQLAAHDGIEFLHEFRSYGEWESIPVIVLTNVTPPALAPLEQALETDLGVKAYLYKPHTSLRKLIRAVQEAAVPA